MEDHVQLNGAPYLNGWRGSRTRPLEANGPLAAIRRVHSLGSVAGGAGLGLDLVRILLAQVEAQDFHRLVSRRVPDMAPFDGLYIGLSG